MGFFICTPSAHLYSYLHKIHVFLIRIRPRYYSTTEVMNIVSTLLAKCLAQAVVIKGHHNVHPDLTIAEHVKNSQTLKRNAIANEKGQAGWLIFLSATICLKFEL
jgi:hypothetical protein